MNTNHLSKETETRLIEFSQKLLILKKWQKQYDK